MAVYLVVVFHAGSDRFSGGFVGVDVFFVLSGFLVTQLLLRDLAAAGVVSFRRFYARRFRRLLPAAFVALVVTALVFSALASPVEVSDAAGGFKASFLYSANWWFIRQSSDYFGADLSSNPVLHFWSLAVEEQFYLVWPLLLGGLYALTRRFFGVRHWKALRAIVAVGAVASVTLAWSLRTRDPNRAYYGTDTRAYQLMAGALLALTPGLITRLRRFTGPARRVGPVAIVALLVVASSWVHLDAIERGIAVTAITIVVLIALETADGGLLHRALSIEPVVYLGKISYGTYLWHWPVVIVLARQFDLAPITTIALTTLVATALASLSYQLLEHPIRVSALLDRHRTPVIATGLALSAFSALTIIPTIVDRATTTASATPATQLTTTGFTPVPTGIDWTALKTELDALVTCEGQPASACTLVRGTGPHILLIGDSHAGMLLPTLTAIAKQHDLTLSVDARGGCPWQRDLYRVPTSRYGLPQPIADCDRHKADVYDRVIAALDPDIVIAVNMNYPGRRMPFVRPDGEVLEGDEAEADRWIDEATRASVDRLAAGGRRVVLVEPTPVAPVGFRPVDCLSTSTVVEQCRFVAAETPVGLEQVYRRIDAASDRIWAADLDQLVCPFLPICDPIVSGAVVLIDGHHLGQEFARSLVPAVDDYLTSNGILR